MTNTDRLSIKNLSQMIVGFGDFAKIVKNFCDILQKIFKRIVYYP